MKRVTVRITGVALVTLLALASLFASAAPGQRTSNDPLTRQLIGHSVQGRAIYAYRHGDPDGRPVLVVGSIHGNEPGGVAVAKRLLELPAPRGVDLWVILELNPDGFAARTRGNAHGVDLNRNFPWHWRHLSGGYYSGPHSLSEPESRAAARLIERVRPRLTIWFHQPADLVDSLTAAARRFARLSGLPVGQLPGHYPGSATSWERHIIPGAVAFVVELPRGKPSVPAVDRYARAVLGVSRG